MAARQNAPRVIAVARLIGIHLLTADQVGNLGVDSGQMDRRIRVVGDRLELARAERSVHNRRAGRLCRVSAMRRSMASSGT